MIARYCTSSNATGQETLRVSLSVFKGKTYVDVRLFYEDANGELAQTKRA